MSVEVTSTHAHKKMTHKTMKFRDGTETGLFMKLDYCISLLNNLLTYRAAPLKPVPFGSEEQFELLWSTRPLINNLGWKWWQWPPLTILLPPLCCYSVSRGIPVLVYVFFLPSFLYLLMVSFVRVMLGEMAFYSEQILHTSHRYFYFIFFKHCKCVCFKCKAKRFWKERSGIFGVLWSC